jgi:hypothetical protein
MRWSSDGRSLYYSYAKPNGIQIDLYGVETGTLQAWKQIPVGESLTRRIVRVTPDGRSYVYFGLEVSSELYLVEGLR